MVLITEQFVYSSRTIKGCICKVLNVVDLLIFSFVCVNCFMSLVFGSVVKTYSKWDPWDVRNDLIDGD